MGTANKPSRERINFTFFNETEYYQSLSTLITSRAKINFLGLDPRITQGLQEIANQPHGQPHIDLGLDSANDLLRNLNVSFEDIEAKKAKGVVLNNGAVKLSVDSKKTQDQF